MKRILTTIGTIILTVITVSSKTPVKFQYPWGETGFSIGKANVLAPVASYGSISQTTNLFLMGFDVMGLWVECSINGTECLPEHVLGWSKYLQTSFNRFGIKPVRVVVPLSQINLIFSPIVFLESYSTGMADTSGNNIGWTDDDYQRRTDFLSQSLNYKKAIGGGIQVGCQFWNALNVGINISRSKYTISYGVSIIFDLAASCSTYSTRH